MTKPSQNTRDFHRRACNEALERVAEASTGHDKLVLDRSRTVTLAQDTYLQALHTWDDHGGVFPEPPEVDTTLADILIDDARFEIDAELRFAQIHATLALSAPG